ncbi:salivary glue protein Sgs-3-like [Anopheles maculipalpis]|uniref:salivary glue protein Sgs-3-like n=1 Tax=Anopheles maculipalpis TaxID=1496333 RepID=UPI002158FAF1|nr:salivary glue protein Sgs-3-like [Anopheles maculipalpis]
MQRSLRLLALLVVGFVATYHCDDVVPVTSTEEAAIETVTAEPVTGDNKCIELSSDGLEEIRCEKCCAEEQFTTVSMESEESTTQEGEFIVSSAVTTTLDSTTTTTTTKPSVRTHSRMVRFGAKRRMSRPTTVEPTQRKPTANSRTLLNRRGLFNPELRNRYLGRFRSTTTTTEPTN